MKADRRDVDELQVSATLHHPQRTRGRRGYSLIEILIVMVILALVATIVVAQFANASDEASDSSIGMQLSSVRSQIESYRAQMLADPDLLRRQWTELVNGNYLQQNPVNVLNGSTLIAAAPAANVGWVWRDTGTGVFDLLATDATFMAEHVE